MGWSCPAYGQLPNILIADVSGIRVGGNPRRHYLYCIMKIRGYELNTDTQNLALDILKWRRIVRGMGHVEVRLDAKMHYVFVFKCLLLLEIL